MGYSDEERQRLTDQAALYDASTRQLFVDAGLGAGARVLDVGCGVGDVSLLAASIVGPAGTVVGVDTDARSLAVAEARARSRGLGQITLREGDFHGAPDVKQMARHRSSTITVSSRPGSA